MSPNLYPECVTWFNQRIMTGTPNKMATGTPSSFQIGDGIEIVLGPDNVIPGTVYAVKFSGNGTVSYDIAVPVEGAGYCTIIQDIRGSMRGKGGTETAEDLQLIGIEEIAPEVRRSTLRLVE